MKYLIKGGLVYSGKSEAPKIADIIVCGERIMSMGENLSVDGAKVIDASGYAVTPGFIDTHRHCDIAPLRDKDFGLIELSQGITTTFAGNCGLAPVPTNPKYAEECRLFLEPILGALGQENLFSDYYKYFDALDVFGTAINMGVLAAAGNVKIAVKGFAGSSYTTSEISQAKEYMRQAMECGAFGVSLGIMYQPECYSDAGEMAAIIQPIAEAGGVLTTHIRGEGDSLVASIEEVIQIARQTGIRLNISHFKSTGIKNWNSSIYKAIKCIEEARADGMEVTADFYPYIGGATTLLSLVPPTILKNGREATIIWLSTRQGKAAFKKEIYKKFSEWDNMALSIGWDRILVSSTSLPEHAEYGGKDIAWLAMIEGYNDPSDFICDLIVSEKGRTGVILLSMSQDDVDTVARLPFTSVISDALYEKGSNPHPRLYGSFPKIIREYVLERSILTMEEAVYKMSGMPAHVFGLRERGVLEEGKYADINIFKPHELRDHATFNNSKQLTTGMYKVFVNGNLALCNGEKKLIKAGKVLRKQS